MATSPASPRSNLVASPTGPYKGVGTLLKHWGNSEVATIEEKQIKICEASGLDSLIHLSRMPHVKVQGLAMAVITSLVEGENGDISIDSEEGFRPLVELTKFAEEDVQREAVWALAILASNSSCQARIEHEVGWHNFRKFAASPVPEIQAGTAILLGNLALEKKNQENMMVKGVPLLLNMLAETKDAKVRRAVVTALSNVSIIEEYGAKDVWLEKGIELMMPFIEQGDDMQLQIGALNTIANVCNHDKATELKRKVAQLGGIGRLVPLLDSQDEMVVKLAAMTVANMASDDNHRNVMHGLHIEDPLIRLLDSRDEEVQLGVTMAINALADHDGTRKAFHSKNAAEPLKELIHLTKDRDIAKEAKEALHKVAPDIYASLNLKDKSYTDNSYSSSSDGSYTSDEGEYNDDEQGDHSGEGESESDTDTDRSDIRRKTAALKKEEEKRLEDQRRVKEEQKRKMVEEERALARRESSNRSVGSNKSVGKNSPTPTPLPVTTTTTTNGKEEKEEKSSTSNASGGASRRGTAGGEGSREGSGRKESKRKIVVPDGADTIVVEVDADVAEEELRLQRKESTRRKERDEESHSDDSDDEHKEGSRITLASEAEDKPEITEAERQKLEEEEKKKKAQEEAERKQKEIEAKKKEEFARSREIEEAAFKRREEVAAVRDIEIEEMAVDEAARSQNSRKGKGRSSRADSVDSFIIPKNPAKNLVHLLRDAKNKKAVTRDALRELEKFASRREKEQLQFGEDIIAILVYVIYFYPEEEYAEILTLTLYLLAILARYHVKNQLAIRRARGGEQMIKLLLSNNEGVKRNAALALGALSLNNKSVQSEVTKAIPILVHTLENLQAPHTTLRTVAACLASIADSNNANQEMIIKEGGLKATVTLLFVHKDVIRSCLNLLSAIVSHNQVAQNLVIHEHGKILPDLLNMLGSAEHADYTDSVSNALVELIKKNTRTQQALYVVGGLGKLVPMLEGFHVDDDRRKLKICANVVYMLYALVRLSRYSSKVRIELTRLRVADLIKPMCASRSPNLAELAMNLTKAIEARR